MGEGDASSCASAIMLIGASELADNPVDYTLENAEDCTNGATHQNTPGRFPWHDTVFTFVIRAFRRIPHNSPDLVWFVVAAAT